MSYLSTFGVRWVVQDSGIHTTVGTATETDGNRENRRRKRTATRNGGQHTGDQTLQQRSEQTREQNVERPSKHERADEGTAPAHSEQAHSEQAHSEQAHSEQAHSEQAHSEQAHSEQNADRPSKHEREGTASTPQATASTSPAERLPQQEVAAPAPAVAPTADRAAALGTPRESDPRMSLLQTQCLKTSLAILSRPTRHAQSLGFTSAVAGEGKSYLATLTATALADRTHRPVTLVDCNWDNPSLHTRFEVAETPGLAEWLRQECDIAQIRHAVSPCLTVIPAGNALSDTVTLTDALRAAGPLRLLTQPEEALIVDMAPILTTPYGALLAQQLDAVLLVVRAGVTWDSYVREACRELSASPVEGVVLNAARSRIPRWLQRIL